MRRVLLFAASALMANAQIVPGHYIVELNTEPVSVTAASRNVRFSNAELQARRAQIQAEHDAAEAAVRNLGGTVTHHYDTLVNAMAVSMTDLAAGRLRQTANVRGVYPVVRHHALLDHAVNVHRIPAAWQTLNNGEAGAGAGIKIAILYTEYLQLKTPNVPVTDSWYMSWIDPYDEPTSSTGKIEQNLQSCASPGFFSDVQTGGDISQALTDLFIKVASSTASLTQ